MQSIREDLGDLSSTFGGRSLRDITDTITELEEEITTQTNAQFESLTNLAKRLAWKYLQTSSIEDIKKAVQYAKMATVIAPANSPSQANWRNNYGSLLVWSYERTGNLDDLQQAVSQIRSALDATPDEHTDRAGRLINLGYCLGRRFERIGAMDDLEGAISNSTKVVELTYPGHPCRASRLSSLGNWLARRHERTGSLNDLEQAILRVQEAVDITQDSHPNRAIFLASLGNMLALQYRQTGNQDIIGRAVNFVEDAITSTPIKSPNRTNWLSNLGTIFTWKYEKTKSSSDLENAILRVEETVEELPDDHPNRAALLFNLGDLIHRRYDRSHSEIDRDVCLSHYKASWACNKAQPAVRIRAAYKSAIIYLDQKEWENASLCLRQAVRLLPYLNLYPYDLKRRDQQHILKEFSGLATLAASAILKTNKPMEALQILELGRGVISWLWFGAKAELLLPESQHTEFIGRFDQSQGYFVSQCPSSKSASGKCTAMPSSNSRHNCAALHPEKGVNKAIGLSRVRECPLSLGETELQVVTSGGPVVVVNVSPVCCNALLLTADSIRPILLPKLRHQDIAENVRLLRSTNGSRERSLSDILRILEWLWDAVASPILEELGFGGPPVDDNWPYVCWIPTGLLSLLPLHAAGYHQSPSLDTVIDRVVSSYSPSVKALLHARRNSIGHYGPKKEVLLVSMEATPGCPPLKTAKDEITAVIEEISSDSTKKSLKEPGKEDILNGLRQCEIFHFAGHSISDPIDPSKSQLLLRDWQENPFTVEDLVGLERQDSRPFLAYLSACSTGVNFAEGLHDESINLMTACQLAGFRHTVGSLWDVYDVYSIHAAREFYRVLGGTGTINDKAVAWGVHAAAKHLRKITRDCSALGPGDPFAWAAYIHTGPV